ncbi:multidrug efflux MFS transporter [Azotosporobacter soli]|uniref:multidrug efflux MFS transporter n=1 Tax=Azotosporobacter soli TaxID=3055040 RepID=UPI0031FF02F4
MEIWRRNLLVCWFGVFVTSAGLSQVIPIMPLYIAHLGVENTAEIERWSGIAFGITTLVMALVSPIWGKAADKYGRKPMLLRASLGMAVVVTAMGFVHNVYQLIGLRLLQGTISGFYAGSITLIATQTPKNHTGWALGTLATGSMAGMLIGPLVGGFLSEHVGMQSVFLSTGVLLLVAFFLSLFFVKEQFTRSEEEALGFQEVWRQLPNQGLVITLIITTFVLQAALYSIEPIITVYIAELSHDTTHVALLSGLVFASSGLASFIAAPRLGKLSDKIGSEKVMLTALIVAGIVFIPQALVENPWQLMALRFILGLATAGLLPSINTLVRRSVPDAVAGRAFGYNQSAQFLGTFSGAVAGGQIAALFGIHYVFFITSFLLLANAAWFYQGIYRKAAL